MSLEGRVKETLALSPGSRSGTSVVVVIVEVRESVDASQACCADNESSAREPNVSDAFPEDTALLPELRTTAETLRSCPVDRVVGVMEVSCTRSASVEVAACAGATMTPDTTRTNVRSRPSRDPGDRLVAGRAGVRRLASWTVMELSDRRGAAMRRQRYDVRWGT